MPRPSTRPEQFGRSLDVYEQLVELDPAGQGRPGPHRGPEEQARDLRAAEPLQRHTQLGGRHQGRPGGPDRREVQGGPRRRRREAAHPRRHLDVLGRQVHPEGHGPEHPGVLREPHVPAKKDHQPGGAGRDPGAADQYPEEQGIQVQPADGPGQESVSPTSPRKIIITRRSPRSSPIRSWTSPPKGRSSRTPSVRGQEAVRILDIILALIK